MTDTTTQASTDGASAAREAEFRPATPINEEPPSISLDEAAERIDKILQSDSDETSPEGNRSEFLGSRYGENGESRGGNAGEEAASAAESRPLTENEYEAVRVKVSSEEGEQEVSLKDLTKVFEQSRTIRAEAQNFNERREVLETALGSAVQQLQSVAPLLESQLIGDFPEIQSPQDLQVLAMRNPQRFMQFQQRQAQLDHARQQMEGIRAYEYDRNLANEAARLAELVPDFADPKKGDEARKGVHAYAHSLGITDDRLREASAVEVSVLHKAMKYDQMQVGMKTARKKTKRPAKVMRPGTDRPSDSRASYRKAMARLKKTGSVEDAAKVIEHML